MTLCSTCWISSLFVPNRKLTLTHSLTPFKSNLNKHTPAGIGTEHVLRLASV